MDLIFNNSFSDGIGNSISISFVSQIVQHIDRSVQHGNWICDIFSSDGCTGVTSSGLENSVLRPKSIQIKICFKNYLNQLQKLFKCILHDHHSYHRTKDQHHRSNRKLHLIQWYHTSWSCS